MATKQLPGLTTLLPADSIDSSADLMLVRDTSTGADVKVKVGTVVGRDHGTAANQVPLNSDLGTAATKNIGTANGDVPLNSYRTGEVFYHAGSTAPAGAMKANGAAVSRTTYAALFAAIGTVFGAGDGSTTFNLPDLRGEFVRGWDDSRGVDSGRAMGSAQTDMLKSHSHLIPTNAGSAKAGFMQTSGIYTSPGLNISTDATGGAETRPRNIALLACIKY